MFIGEILPEATYAPGLRFDLAAHYSTTLEGGAEKGLLPSDACQSVHGTDGVRSCRDSSPFTRRCPSYFFLSSSPQAQIHSGLSQPEQIFAS